MKLRHLCLPLLLTVTGTHAATWNGGGADTNWGTALNWGGTAPVNGNPLVFAGITQQTNVNNSLTAIGALSFTSRGWNITGNDVTLGGDVTFLTTSGGTGDVVWGINTELTATRKFQVDNVVVGALNITGLISGIGGFTRGTGGTGDGTLRLSNTGNTFTGAVTLDGGITEVVGLADSGSASSLGKGGTITLGSTASNFASTLSFVGSGSTATNRALSLSFRQDLSVQTLNNNSTGNGDLTYSSTAAVAMVNNNSTLDGSGNSTGILTFGGSSTGVTTFAGLLQNNPSDSKDILRIAKTGSGTLLLSNANTYTGGTTIASGGTVRATHSSALGSGLVTVSSGGALALDGGISTANALSLTGTGVGATGALVSLSGANTVSGNITLAGTTTISNTDLTGVSLTLAGTLDLSSNLLTLAGKNRQLTVSGKVTGTASKLTVQTSTGSNVTFSNNTSDFKAAIESGAVRNLQFSSIANVGGGASALGAPTTAAEGTITFKNGNSFTRFEYTGTTAASTNRVLQMGGNSGALNLVNSGGAKLTYTADLVRDATSTGGLDIGPTAGSTIEFAGKISNGASATPLNLNLSGAGTTILSGANTYGGTTTVNSGASLVVNGDNSLATGTVTVASSAKLTGSGTVGGATTIQSGGTHGPGNSPGVQTFSSDLTYSGGSIFSWDLASLSETGRGTVFDGVNVGGGLTIAPDVSTGSIFQIVLGTSGSQSSTFWNTSRAWNVFNVTGTITDTFTRFSVVDSSFSAVTIASPGSFTFNGGTGALNWTAVPEPTSALAGLLLGAGLLRRRR